MDSKTKDNRSSSACVPILGQHNFNTWKKRFFAHLILLKCEEALSLSFLLPVDPKNPPKKQKELMQKNIQANNMVVAALTLAFTHPEHLELVDDAATDAYPQGVVHKIMTKLKAKINPEDDIAKVEAEIELAKLQFTPKADPDHYFTKLAVIKAKYKSSRNFTKNELVINVMSKIPEEYTATVLAEQRRCGNRLKLEFIKEAMKAHWRITQNKMRSKKSKDKNEVTLSLHDTYSHKKVNKNYPDNNRFAGKKRVKSNIICNTCGKKGHRAEDCWLNPKNAHKRPNSWKNGSNNESGRAGLKMCLSTVSKVRKSTTTDCATTSKYINEWYLKEDYCQGHVVNNPSTSKTPAGTCYDETWFCPICGDEGAEKQMCEKCGEAEYMMADVPMWRSDSCWASLCQMSQASQDWILVIWMVLQT